MVFLEILQYSQETTCARDSPLIKLQALDTFFYRTPKVAASDKINSVFTQNDKIYSELFQCFDFKLN